jgi:hypothetical protein
LALEPGGKRGVDPWTTSLRETRVRDFAREGVLDRVLALAGDARARTAAYEVAILEDPQVGRALDQLVHRPRPEDAPDHRGRLEGGLLGGAEEVDPRGKDRVHGVRHGELRRKLA